MAKIYQYQKASDDFTEYRVQGEGVNELCTIDGITFISVTNELPAYDERLTVTETVLTAELLSQIKGSSPHVALINERIKSKIREKYDAEDEMYFARISIGTMMGAYTFQAGEQEAVLAYGAFIESIRQGGRAEKEALGLA